LDAAEVAHGGGKHAVKVLVAQYVEHGAAGGAAWLAVVNRRRLSACQQGPAHMGSARMLRPQRGHDLLRASAVRHRLDARDEAAFLDQELAVDWCGDGGWHKRGD